ncbi:MAG: hypothetical protein GXY48_09455 [Methanomicrobiales archaeon]|nr:hypothetical protein [Methanomicrobiales archaeon]
MYTFVGDVSGFKNIIQNLTLTDQSNRVHQWIDLIKELIRIHDIRFFRLISDSIVVVVDEKPMELIKLCRFSKALLEQGIEKSFPIRGAITKGDVDFSNDENIVFGKAIVDGFILADNQKWFGIVIDTSIRDELRTLWNIDKVICYSPPLKVGDVRLYPVISWEVPSTSQLIRYTTSEGLMRPESIVNWEYYVMIQNTQIFSLYRSTLKQVQINSRNDVDWSKFYGLTPIEIIENAIRKSSLDVIQVDNGNPYAVYRV